MSDATSLMQQICTAQVFQPETVHNTPIQVLGIMEALSAPVDAIWVLQMNDHIWPPPARPNALLPAHIQRAARLPNADNSVQASFAAGIHQRVLHSAKTVIFSSSQRENTTQLRASPLIKDVETISQFATCTNLGGNIIQNRNADLTHWMTIWHLPCKLATMFLAVRVYFKAQAICPAWAFYQYRLGAKSLKIPSEGLDNLARGQLVHAVLAAFWQPVIKSGILQICATCQTQRLISKLNKAIPTPCTILPKRLTLPPKPC
jgi:hypothetical protein